MVALDQWFSNFYVIWETADTADVLVSPCDALMHVAYTFKVIWASLMLESHHFKLRTLSQCSAISSDGKWSWENPKLTQTPSSIPGDTAHSHQEGTLLPPGQLSRPVHYELLPNPSHCPHLTHSSRPTSGLSPSPEPSLISRAL